MAEKDKLSLEERVEKIEKNKTQDQRRRERAEELEKLKSKPIKYVDDDPRRIHMSYDEVVKSKQAKNDEAAEFEKFKAEKKAKKDAPKEDFSKENLKEAAGAAGELAKDKPKSKGRPKKVE